MAPTPPRWRRSRADSLCSGAGERLAIHGIFRATTQGQRLTIETAWESNQVAQLLRDGPRVERERSSTTWHRPLGA